MQILAGFEGFGGLAAWQTLPAEALHILAGFDRVKNLARWGDLDLCLLCLIKGHRSFCGHASTNWTAPGCEHHIKHHHSN